MTTHKLMSISTAVSFLLTIAAVASGQFTPSPGSPVGLTPESVAEGDFNGDGKLDLAFANQNSNTVTVMLGNAAGRFTPAPGSPFPVGTEPQFVVVGDFNGDSKLDLVIANASGGTVTVLLGNGMGGFMAAPGSPFPAGAWPYSVAVGDFNADGKSDLAIADANGGTVTVLLGNGTGEFTAAPGSPFQAGTVPVSVAVGDFNRDGKPDLAIANGGTGGDTVTVLLGNGTGGFAAAPGSPFLVGTNPTSVAVGDFNGDGQPDLVTANSFSNNVTVLLGNGTGGFTAAPGSPFPAGTEPLSVAVGDFNGDGKPDLIISNGTVLLGNGTGGFTAAPGSPFLVGTGPISVAVGDFNGDGKPDFAIANLESNNVTVLLNDTPNVSPNWRFMPAPGSPFPAGVAPVSVAQADFNVDGKLDLALVDQNNNTVTVLLGNGTGEFAAATGSPFPVGDVPQAVVAGDFNIDGKPDLAIANALDNNVTVLLGNGTGGFTAAQGSPFLVGLSPHSVAVGDFNGDGKQDLATANANGGDITVLLGNGAGGFAAAPDSPFPVGTNPSSVAAGDFNGDGKPDLVVANGGPAGDTVTVLLGNGAGGFTASSGSPFPAGTDPSAVVVGDFNGDGKLDFAVSNSGSNNVTVLLGNGAGGFTAALGSPFPVGTNPSAVVVGDFDQDGNLDLSISNRGDGTVTVLLGNGTGGFTAAPGSPFPAGSSPESLVAGDFNGDGKLDLAIPSVASNNVTVLLNTPFVASDFNDDGHPDVIWEEPAIGWAQVWYLGGAQGVSLLGAANLTLSNPWHIVAVADFDGNGTPDVVWQDPASGAVQVWYMGGPGGNVVMSAANVTSQNPWQVVSVADFNHDGHPDLLWEDPASGFSQIWYLGGPQGITLMGAADLDQTNPWHIVGTGDFNGDGVPDVLWQDPASGTVQIWYMGGTTPGQEGSVLQSAVNLTANPWHVVAIADFNQDGHPDVVFQDPATGAAQVFFYTGAQGTIPSGSAVLSAGNPWYIAGPR